MSSLYKLYSLLTVRQRGQAAVILCLMLVGVVLETLSIGLVIPAIGLMTQLDIAENYPQLRPVMHALGNPDRDQLVIGGILALFGLYLAKAIFMAFLTWRQNEFVFGARAYLSQRLFRAYLRQPWTFHIQRNSAELINILSTETNQFTASALQPAFILLTEGLILVGICSLLVAIETSGALLVVAILGLATWGFQRLTRGKIYRWGQARQYHEGLRVQHLQQGLGGVKDIKILGREVDFLAQYGEHSLGAARATSLQNTFLQLPRYWMEVLAIAAMAILVVLMIVRGSPPATVLPTLGLFAVAAFRLMPSVSRISSCLQSLTYAKPIIDTLHQEFDLYDKDAPLDSVGPLSFKKDIILEQVSYRYPDAAAPILTDVNLIIPRGSSVGFVGGSGAGKSTLVDLILGLLSPFDGLVKVDGVDIQTNLRGWQEKIGYVSQSIFLTDDSVRRNVAFGIPDDQIDDRAVDRALRAAQLEDFMASLPDGVHTLVGERGVRISGGQRQRIGIARALYHDPSVLVLDEATSALDSETEKGVMDAVNALAGDKTILIVAHRLSTIQRCDRLYRLDHGKVRVDDASSNAPCKASAN